MTDNNMVNLVITLQDYNKELDAEIQELNSRIEQLKAQRRFNDDKLEDVAEDECLLLAQIDL